MVRVYSWVGEGKVKAMKKDNRPVIYNKISDVITEEIRFDGKTTVYDDLGNEQEMYTLLEKKYNINISKFPEELGKQSFNTLKEAKDMEFRLQNVYDQITSCYKAYGIGWDNHQPAVIVIQPITKRADLYWFEEKDNNIIFYHERFSSFPSACDYIKSHYGNSCIERWLTVNSKQWTGKKVLSITDWLLRRP